MGCHTWFYKDVPTEDIDFQEMKDTVITHIEKMIYLSEKYKNDEENTDDEKKELHNDSLYFRKILEHLKNGKLDRKRKLLKLYAEAIPGSTNEIIDGKLYKEVDYHDLFRTPNYEQKPLRNLIETCLFLANEEVTGGTCMVDGNLEEQPIHLNLIKTFWKKYPNGIITFG